MRAKEIDSPPEEGNYLCLWCDAEFGLNAKGNLTCPSCSNANRTDMVTIYMEDNPKEDAFYTKDDWHGGD